MREGASVNPVGPWQDDPRFWRELARLVGLEAAADLVEQAWDELQQTVRQAQEVLSYPIPEETEPALLFSPGWVAGPEPGPPAGDRPAAPRAAASAALTQPGPEAGQPAWMYSLSEASRLIRQGALSASELVEACLERIGQVEPKVQAWVEIVADQARDEARRAEAAIRAGEWLGPLHGIPFGVKDIFHVAGLPTRAGTAGWKVEPSRDSEAVARLRRAGAILLGKTTTTEFAFRDPAPTRNPWNPDHTPGGSSSGSAAAVAARMVPLALGSQTGGSLSRPAAYCGVVTLKPTYGRVSRRGVLPLAWSLDHVGAFTVTVEDQVPVLAALFGQDPEDATTWLAPPATAEADRPAGQRLVVGVPDRFFRERCEGETWELFQQALRQLEAVGYAVEQVPLPGCFEAAQAAHAIVMRVEAAAYHLERLRRHPELLRPGLRRLVLGGAVVPAVVYERAQQVRRLYVQEMAALLRRVDLLATPATPGPAPRGLDWTGPFTFNGPFSMAGLPTLTVPMGWVASGLPVGLQLAAAPYAEGLLIQAGMAYQRETHWHRRVPLADG